MAVVRHGNKGSGGDKKNGLLYKPKTKAATV
jgi:hypothetical protein